MGNDLHQPGKQAGGAADNDQRVGENKDPHGLGEGHPLHGHHGEAGPQRFTQQPGGEHPAAQRQMIL